MKHKKRTGWTIECVLDQTWGYLAKPQPGDGADEHYFTTDPKEARIVHATGREAAQEKAADIMGHPVSRGCDQRDGTGQHRDPEIDGTECGEWIKFIPDVAAFRRGPATW